MESNIDQQIVNSIEGNKTIIESIDSDFDYEYISDDENVVSNDQFKIDDENTNNFNCYVANDNTNGQVVVSGKNDQLKKFMDILKEKKIKNIKLPVSAPFHCPLMNKASEIMSEEIQKLDIKMPKIKILSNVNAKEIKNVSDLKKLLISQIESRVRWREIINCIIHNNCNNFIEIGPGKVLSGLIKRIDKTVNINTINKYEDIKNINLND